MRDSGEQSRAELLRASPPMFRRPTIDRLTRVHPATPALIFVPVIAVLAGIGFDEMHGASPLYALVGGYAFWTLTEYWLHRAVFHFEPERGLGARIHWMIHGVHHDHPNDPMRLVMPPVLSVPLAATFWTIFVAVLGMTLGSAFGAAFFTGYLVYDMLHFALHHSRPRGRVGRWLHELHMRHHFEDDERGFGVSVPYWDIVFGTYTRRRRRAASA
jgi:sterol desaturase/sphingolipid hydroxylase (fatty acid hydroxylase superfamily)